MRDVRSGVDWLARTVEPVPAKVRVPVAVAVVVAVGVVVNETGPSWLAYVGGFVVAAVVGLLVNRYAPTLIERVSSEGPLQALIGADGAVHSDGWSLLVPEPVSVDDFPTFVDRPTAEQVRSAFSEHRPYDLGTSHLRLAVVGQSRDPVIIQGVRARVIARNPVPNGVIVMYPSAGAQEALGMQFDLDREDPQAQTDEGPYFADYSLVLAEREAQDIRIGARSTNAAVEWNIEISYSWRGESRLLVLDNQGETFRTAPRSATGEWFVWQWWEAQPSFAPEPAIQ